MSAIALPSRAVARRRAKSRSASRILGHVAAFSAVIAVSYGVSSLAGNTLMEKARREGLNAQARSRQAKMDVALLRDRIERLTSMQSVEQWASFRGFVSPDQLFAIQARQAAAEEQMGARVHARNL